MEIILVEIKNGWLLVHGQESLYCKDSAELHKELEFLIGKLPEPPRPPQVEPKDFTGQTPKGVRQFDDED